MPDGSFLIVNKKDMENVIKSYGRASDKAAAKKWIAKRAGELGEGDMLLENW